MSIIEFRDAFPSFLQYHQRRRSGSALERIATGLGHAEMLFLEKVWWPAVGSFRYVHPEFEVRDSDGKPRYIDVVYRRRGLRLAIEVDGFHYHANISQWQFIDQTHRTNLLAVLGFHVLRFAVDDIRNEPRKCQQVLLEFLARWGREDDLAALDPRDQVALRLARDLSRPVTPTEVAAALHCSRKVSRAVLHHLVDSGWMQPASGSQRVRSFRFHPNIVF